LKAAAARQRQKERKRPMTARTELGPPDGGNAETAWQGHFLKAHIVTDIGRKRQHNEDAFLFCVPGDDELVDHRGMLFAVADGMGGASAGEHASRLTLEVLCETYFNAPYEPAPKALRQALEKANAHVYREAVKNPEYAGMGTTASAVSIVGEWAYIAQVGDSRVYLVRDRVGVQQLTQDHSLVAEQVRSGLISLEQAKTHSLKNLITRAIGIKESVAIDLFAVRIKQHDTIVICSDGLSNNCSDDEMRAALSNGDLRSGTHKLVNTALNHGGSDNITSLCVHVTKPPPRTNLQEGATEVQVGQETLIGKIRGLFG